MRARITERGAHITARQLQTMGVRATHQAPTMRAAGRDAAQSVRGVAVDTGRLKSSIELLEADDGGFTVGSKVPYARFVFYGTKNMKAQPPDVPKDIGRRTSYVVGRGIVIR